MYEKCFSSVATRDQINAMLAAPKHGLTNELLTASINDGFELAYADIDPAYVSIILEKCTPLFEKVWHSFADLCVARVGSEENSFEKLYFSLPYSNSLALSLDYFAMQFFDDIVAGDLEVRLENTIAAE